MPAKLTTEQFIINAKKTHGDFYTYDKVVYKSTHTKVIITCPLHGDFSQTPANHCFGQRCPDCGELVKIEKKTKTNDTFIEECVKKHGTEKYDYSLVVYTGIFNKIKLICDVHGEFEMIAHDHQQGKGCNKCGILNRANGQRFSTEHFIKLSRKKHGQFYDYSKVQYTGAYGKVEIICPLHGSFMQQASTHYGVQECGCPTCGSGETYKFSEIDLILGKSKKEATFEGCKDKNKLRFDRYLKNKNILLEYDGEQHFRPNTVWNTKDSFEKLKRRDKIKTTFAITNNFNFIRIKYDEDHIKALEQFLKLVGENPGKQVVQIYGKVHIL